MFFKCENLQKTGAFKARGACNAVLKAKEDLGNGLKGVYLVFAFWSSAFGSSRNLLLMLLSQVSLLTAVEIMAKRWPTPAQLQHFRASLW